MKNDLPTENGDILELDLPEPEPEPFAEAEPPTCPRCGHPRNHDLPECTRCGIIFDRVRDTRERPPSPVVHAKVPFFSRKYLGKLLFTVNPDAGTAVLAAKSVFLLILAIWGFRLILAPIASNAAGNSILHLVNLPFHEAGHVFFRPFGRFITSLGGSLGQLIVPLVCCLVLLFKTRDTFGAAVCLWWYGENHLDLAPYINDARSLVLPLVGGTTGRQAPYGFHDWQYILTESGLIQYDHAIAAGAQVLGATIMVLALAWGGYLVWQQFRFHRNPIQPR